MTPPFLALLHVYFNYTTKAVHPPVDERYEALHNKYYFSQRSHNRTEYFLATVHTLFILLVTLVDFNNLT